jgi:hypothetical protein
LQAFRASCALHLMQMVNVGFPEKNPVWFRNGGCGRRVPHFWRSRGINRDFSADRISRISGEISKN